MSFREKSAWISFVLILLAFGIYFTAVARAMTGLLDYGSVFRIFIGVLAALVMLEIAIHVVLAIRSPREAAASRDERERLIGLKATRIAFYVLTAGALVGVFTMHLGADMRAMGNSVLLAVVLAELVKFGAEIVYFRRGA